MQSGDDGPVGAKSILRSQSSFASVLSSVWGESVEDEKNEDATGNAVYTYRNQAEEDNFHNNLRVSFRGELITAEPEPPQTYQRVSIDAPPGKYQSCNNEKKEFVTKKML